MIKQQPTLIRATRAGRICNLLVGVSALALIALAPDCFAQAKYEVVSVRPANPNEVNSGFSDGPQGGVRAHNITALQTLLFAYGIRSFQLIGIPSWARSQRFDITFTPAEAEGPPGDEINAAYQARWSRQRERMQAVLRERFGLAMHTEIREMPIYSLTIAQNGPKLNSASHPDSPQTVDLNTIPGGYRLKINNGTIGALTDALTWRLERVVRDETGLNGKYDVNLEWSSDVTPGAAGPNRSAPSEAPSLPSIFTAIREQLGLHLKPTKGPQSVFVIDKIQQPELDQ